MWALASVLCSLLPGAALASAAGGSDRTGGVPAAPILMISGHRINFHVVGDWGRQGGFNQSEVAADMASSAATQPIEFVISTGDNFYPSGLTSTDDPKFDDTFSRVYSQPELQVPWLVVLGNHDYGDGIVEGGAAPACPDGTPDSCFPGPLHQLSAELAQRDWRWFCRRSFKRSLAGGALDIFFYDTAPFVQYYYDRSWAGNPGGLLEQSWRSNLAELEADLAASTAGWKLVVGHHPVRSNGEEHGDTPELREHVEPLLERYGVQLYLAGHDHDLEHIHARGRRTHHIVSGGGSQCRDFKAKHDALFQHPAAGFVSLEVERDTLRASFHGIGGSKPLYSTVIPRVQPDSGMWRKSVVRVEAIAAQVAADVEAITSGLGAVLTMHEAL